MVPKKVLIIRFSSIGDIILCSPVMRCVKQQFPHISIHFATKKQFNYLLESNPYIDQVHLLESDLSALIKALSSEKFDLIIDLHHNLRTAMIKLRLGVKSYSFNKLNLQKFLMVKLKVNKLPEVHIVDRYLECVTKLGVVNDGQGLDYFMPVGIALARRDQRLPETSFLALVIGAKFSTKRLPNDKLVALCRLLKQPIVLLGGPEDKERGDFIKAAAEGAIYNLCGELSFHESVSVLQHASIVITHDTGLMHAAAALKKPIISIWGNTIPEFGMYPYLPNQQTLNLKMEVSHLACRPCSKIGYDACPKAHFKCMENIELKTIEQTVNQIFKPLQA